ncbi:hypothetical protein BS47DRAFT_1403040 [Hydnum rufescens UP504]|uniref:Uncharacterized protein n=1 Tax=Hydnum rufescens UP504 TaxID=1448309 RepID=A0A9P6ADC6_9AGAM|nr:hypothetical protein BS47DRAFT_1403040 [Hydnum rufescens UP504]
MLDFVTSSRLAKARSHGNTSSGGNCVTSLVDKLSSELGRARNSIPLSLLIPNILARHSSVESLELHAIFLIPTLVLSLSMSGKATLPPFILILNSSLHMSDTCLLLLESNINEFEAFPLERNHLPHCSLYPSTTARLVKVSSTSPIRLPSGSLTHSISSYNSKSISTPLVAQSLNFNGSMTPPTTVPLIVIAPARPPSILSHPGRLPTQLPPVPMTSPLSLRHYLHHPLRHQEQLQHPRRSCQTHFRLRYRHNFPATTPSASSLPTSGNTSRPVGVVVGSIFGAS